MVKQHSKVLLFLAAMVLIAAGCSSEPSPEAGTNPDRQAITLPQTSGPETKTFDVEGSSFKFSLPEIRVKRGDTVKIRFKNINGFHDWVVDEFSARTPVIESGQTSEIEFLADKAGIFEYYCSVGSHRQMGMKGNLVVE